MIKITLRSIVILKFYLKSDGLIKSLTARQGRMAVRLGEICHEGESLNHAFIMTQIILGSIFFESND